MERSKEKLRELLERNAANESTLLRLMNDRTKGPVSEVRADQLKFDKAHAITAPFIVMPDYGTRCTTVVMADTSGKWRFTERRFDPAGQKTGESKFTF